MALQIRFFMAEEDERELLRRLERLGLELWPELTEPSAQAEVASPAAVLEQDAYYLAAGDVIGSPIKKGPQRGRYRIDEVASPVIYFFRSRLDEDGELRSMLRCASCASSSRSGSARALPSRARRISSVPRRRGSPRRGSRCGKRAARESWFASTADEAGRR